MDRLDYQVSHLCSEGGSSSGVTIVLAITRCSPSQSAHPPLLPWPSQLKRKGAIDLNGEKPQQDPAKRRKAAHNIGQATTSPGNLSGPAGALTDGQYSIPVDSYRGSSLAAERRVRVAKSSAEYRKRKANSTAHQRDSTARTDGNDPALSLTPAAVDHSVATGDAHRGAIPHPASVSSATITKSTVGCFTYKKRAGGCGERKAIRKSPPSCSRGFS